MSKYGIHILRILDALEHVGPMTTAELVLEVGASRATISRALTRLCAPSLRPKGPRRVRIADWRDDSEGTRRYMRPVYALGRSPDAPRPDRKTNADYCRQYRDRCKARESCQLPF